jgi:hypothetical protein
MFGCCDGVCDSHGAVLPEAVAAFLIRVCVLPVVLYCTVLCMHTGAYVEKQVQDFTQTCAYVSYVWYSINTNSSSYLWWCWSTVDLKMWLTVMISHTFLGDCNACESMNGLVSVF